MTSRKSFYKSKAWMDMRRYIWLKQNCICNRCGKAVYVDKISKWLPKEKRLKGIVHHIDYLNDSNIIDDSITLNEDNLEGICIECHNKEHFKGLGSTKKDVTFDDNGNLVPRNINRINNYKGY